MAGEVRRSRQPDPVARAAQIVHHFGRSKWNEIEACRITHETIEQFGTDRVARDRFTIELTKLGVLPRRDGIIAPASPSKAVHASQGR